jgi:hypothetical protein
LLRMALITSLLTLVMFLNLREISLLSLNRLQVTLGFVMYMTTAPG